MCFGYRSRTIASAVFYVLDKHGIYQDYLLLI